MVEDINDQASDFTANSVAMSSQTLSRLEDINTRWKLLQLGLDEQYKKLNEVHNNNSCTIKGTSSGSLQFLNSFFTYRFGAEAPLSTLRLKTFCLWQSTTLGPELYRRTKCLTTSSMKSFWDQIKIDPRWLVSFFQSSVRNDPLGSPWNGHLVQKADRLQLCQIFCLQDGHEAAGSAKNIVP